MKISKTLVASTAALALFAGACGSSDETGADAGQEEATTTEETTTEEEPAEEEMAEGEMASLPSEQFGPACSAIPAEGEGSSDGMADDPVATAASNNPVLSTLVTAVTEAGLVDTLNSAEGLTVFAPSNDAFAKIPEETLNSILADKELLTTVLTYHVVGGQNDAPALAEAGTVTPLAEGLGDLAISAEGETVSVEANASTATVVCGNVTTANATVHIIDTVLLPQELS